MKRREDNKHTGNLSKSPAGICRYMANIEKDEYKRSQWEDRYGGRKGQGNGTDLW